VNEGNDMEGKKNQRHNRQGFSRNKEGKKDLRVRGSRKEGHGRKIKRAKKHRQKPRIEQRDTKRKKGFDKSWKNSPEKMGEIPWENKCVRAFETENRTRERRQEKKKDLSGK